MPSPWLRYANPGEPPKAAQPEPPKAEPPKEPPKPALPLATAENLTTVLVACGVAALYNFIFREWEREQQTKRQPKRGAYGPETSFSRALDWGMIRVRADSSLNVIDTIFAMNAAANYKLLPKLAAAVEAVSERFYSGKPMVSGPEPGEVFEKIRLGYPVETLGDAFLKEQRRKKRQQKEQRDNDIAEGRRLREQIDRQQAGASPTPEPEPPPVPVRPRPPRASGLLPRMPLPSHKGEGGQ